MSGKKKVSARAEQFLNEFAEHGFGVSRTWFLSKYGYGSTSIKRWKKESEEFTRRFKKIEEAHKARAKAVPGQAVSHRALEASHTQGLEIWQQNFLESWRRTKRKLSACAKAKVNLETMEESLRDDVDFYKAYKATEREIMVGLQDELMVKAYEGSSVHIAKVFSNNAEETKVVEDKDVEWWKDTISVSKHYVQ